MTNKAEEIEKILTPAAESANIEIVDVQYLKENGDWIARIFIDKSGGVNIDDCEKMSGLFGEILDGSDILTSSYLLEVSSPGINRVLKKEKDFKKFVGEKIRLRTEIALNNQKNFLGRLVGFENGKIKIEDVTNGTVELDFSNVKKANLETDF